MLFLTTAFVCGFPVGAKISTTNIAIKTEAIREKRNIQVRKQQRSVFHSGIHFFQTGIFFSRRRHVCIKRGHLAMLTLDQLPFQAEGYRDLVCLITNYGRWHCGPTRGSRRRGDGWDCDIAIALSQNCPASDTWHYGAYDRAWLRVGGRDGVAGSAGTLDAVGVDNCSRQTGKPRGTTPSTKPCQADAASRVGSWISSA